MGRKEKEKKTTRLEVRLTEKEREKLNDIMEKTGKSATEVVVEGLRIYGNLVKYQN